MSVNNYGNANVIALLPVYGGNILANNITGTLTTAVQPNISVVGTLTYVSTTGNIDGLGNIRVVKDITSTQGNLYLHAGGITAVGNIVANLTMIGSNVVAFNTLSGNAGSITGNITVGNIYTDGYYYANGTPFSGGGGGAGNYSNANVAAYLPINTADLRAGNALIEGNLSVIGNITFLDTDVIVTNQRTVELANNASSSAAANGAGLEVGPLNGAYATLLWDQPNDSWDIRNNIRTPGNVFVGGNTQIQANLSVIGNVNVSSNVIVDNSVIANLYYGNGFFLTGLQNSTNRIFNGNTSVDILSPDANVEINVSLTGNVAQFTPAGLDVNGNITTSGVYGNILGANYIFANVFSGNTVSLAANATVTGNVISGNVSTGNLAAGNIAISNTAIRVADTAATAGQANGAGIIAGAVATPVASFLYDSVTDTWDSTVGISVVGNIAASGNVTAGNIQANIVSPTIITNSLTANVANIVSVIGNTVSITGNITSNNISSNASTITSMLGTTVSVSGNITAGNISTAGNVNSSNIIATTSRVTSILGTTVSVTGNINSANITTGNISGTGNILTTGNISTTGNIAGNVFIGNGSQLSNVVATSLINGNSNIVVQANGSTTFGSIGLSNVLAISSSNIYTNNSNLVVGANSVAANISINSLVHTTPLSVTDTGSAPVSQALLRRYSASTPSIITLAVNSSETIGTNSDVVNSQVLGRIQGAGFVLADYKKFANIDLSVDDTGTLSGTSSPGKIVFSTAPNGSITPVARLVINSDGNAAFSSTISAAGNIVTTGNISSAGNVVVTGNISTAGNLSAAGNVTGTYFLGDGSKLTGIAPTVQVYQFTGNASGIGSYYDAVWLANYVAGTVTTVGATVSTTPTNIASYITQTGYPNLTVIPSGTINTRIETLKGGGVGQYYCYAEIYKRTTGGVETLIVTSDNSSTSAVNTIIQQSLPAYITTPVTLLATDRIITKVYARMVTGTATISLRWDDNTGSGLELPALPASAAQFVPYNNATANIALGIYNLTAGNITTGNLSLTGTTIIASQVGNVVSTTGNIAAQYYYGNGSQLTGIVTSLSNINNGTSNVNISTTNGNITASVSGVGNVVVITPTGISVTGTVNATTGVTTPTLQVKDIISTGNISATGVISSTGTITSGSNIQAQGVISATGGLGTAGTISAVGNISGGNISVVGRILGDFVGVPGAQLQLGSLGLSNNISATGTLYVGGTASVVGTLTAPEANITILNIPGVSTISGTSITGVQTTTLATANANIILTGDTTGLSGKIALNAGGNSVVLVGNTGVSVTGNLSISGAFNPGNITTGNIGAGNISASGNIYGGNLSVSGNVNSTYLNSSIVYATTISSQGGIFANSVISTFGTVAGLNVFTGGISATGNVRVGGFMSTVGNIIGNSSIFAYGTTTSGFGAIHTGPLGFTALPSTTIQITANANTYAQLNAQNLSTGTDAATEYVATADNGSDTTYFVDMGIVNSTYDNASPSNSLGNSVYPRDSYVYAQGDSANTAASGGNLVLGTSTPNKVVRIISGGNTASNVVSTFDNTGLIVTGQLSASGAVYANAAAAIAFVSGPGAVSNVALLIQPPSGGTTPANQAIRDLSSANTTIFFDAGMGAANTGHNFLFRGSNAFTTYANINSSGINSIGPLKVNGNQTTNGPSFFAYNSNSQTITTDVQTKLNFNTEDWDTNNNFASDRFTPTVAGYYQVSGAVRISNIGTGERMITIWKNGAEWVRACNDKGTAAVGDSWFQMSISAPVYFNGTTDYVELYAQHGAGSNQTTTAGRAFTNFSAIMVRGA